MADNGGLLNDKVAVVTGAGRGLGRAEALHLAELGARVVVNDFGVALSGDRQEEQPAQQVVDEIVAAGGEAVAHLGDVADWDDSKALIDLAIERFGDLHIVVNNAGILRDRMIFNMTPEEWDAVLRVHLRGTFLCTQAVCSHWRDRAKAGQAVGGAIVNTSSTSGLLGMAGQSNYGTAKAGIAAFTQIVSMEMARYGVRVNAIAPGARTRMTEQTFGDLEVPEGEFDPLAPENVAPLVAYLVSEAAEGITGQVFGITGGLVQLYRGWNPVAEEERGRRWTPQELAERVPAMFGERPSAYAPEFSPLRRITGISGT